MQKTGGVLSLRRITKRFPGVLALNNVSIDFRKGEVHALLGENGAGKSTLIKVLAGAHAPDEGEIVIEDKTYDQMNPRLAKQLGIQVIYQEFNLIPPLTAAENIFLGDMIGNGFTINRKAMIKETEKLFASLNIKMNPLALVRDMSPAQQQIVEIAKAISKDVKLLVMDEPSAPLTLSEVGAMFDIVRALKAKGVTIVYISHRMEELFEIADRITVMRDGQYIGTMNTGETNRGELISLMVGRELTETYPARHVEPVETILEVSQLSGYGFSDISFSVKRGEILGFSGLIGAGRTELVRSIFGAEPAYSGRIRMEGKDVVIRSPRDAIALGIGLIPEDRKQQGVILRSSVKRNISLPNLRALSRFGLVNSALEQRLAQQYKDSLHIKTPSLDQLVNNLSGGNQQKVVLAKWLARNCKVLIFDEPTRGIDVGAKQEIYKLMCGLAESGVAIIMISSDMEEIFGMSDRIIVLCEGRKTGELQKSEFAQERIMELASNH
ncbi:sugar ABC transporter ATP-binding protein [Paenibacillus zanthoxyli]|uniref:sugar ABC transporter ATP-binding protein n=1 Tax=Paenibacillus zanthoxyli TaxID=369399 RepID=UPI00046F0AE6|nr:sugar ABC transporter ATP-binding protein [Paenibacillus zanthoxyli]